MEPCDSIIIDDSPPTTPSPAVSMYNSNATATTAIEYNAMMTSGEDEFSPTEQAMIWSQATTNFIKNTMDMSVQHNDKMLSLHHKMNLMSFNRYQSSTSTQQEYHQYSEIGNYIPDYGYNQSIPPQYQYIPYYGYYPNLNYQQEFMYNFERANYMNYIRSYYGNYKFDENNQENSDPTAQYYFDIKTESPFENFEIEPAPLQPFEARTEDVQSEIVDIQCLSGHGQESPLQNILNKTVDNKQPTATKGKKKATVPLFLKRNRVAFNTPMEHKQNATMTSSQMAEDDVVFVKEYKCETIPVVSQSLVCAPVAKLVVPLPRKPTVTAQTSDNCDNTELQQKLAQNEQTLVTNTRPVVRRNPKRQVQVEKNFLKMIDEVLDATAKTERKTKKLAQNMTKTTRPAIKNLRRSKRNLSHCGATYRAPLPITVKDFKAWPVEGGHERPEYNPVTKKIEPFDYHIRNISKDFARKPATPTANIETRTAPPVCSKLPKKKCKTLPEVSHEMLHHVLAYVVRVKKHEHEETLKEQQVLKENMDKVEFLNDLCLNEVKAETDQQSCDLLKHAVDVCQLNGLKSKSSNKFDVTDLLQNSILMYCLTNNVEQAEVARYIASISPEEAIEVSNEILELPN